MHILFICNGNVARSQEAEAYFNALSHDASLTSGSAGIDVRPGKPIDPAVIQVMREDGISLETAHRKVVTEGMVLNSDLVISFKPEDELPEVVKQAGNIEYWDIPDPRNQDIEFHRSTRTQIKQLVIGLLDRLQPARTS